jgi:putative thioredoxin
MFEVDEARFPAEVIERSRQTLVLVDFTAGWCGPCQVLGPILERLTQEYQGRFVLAQVDFDRNPGLAMQLGVQGIPAVFAFQDGQLAGHFVGAQPEARVRQFLERLLPSPAEAALRRARDLAADRPAEALRLLEEAAPQQRDNEDLAALRAQVLLALGRDQEARASAEQVSEASQFYQDAANTLAVLRFRDEARQLGGLDRCQTRLASQPQDARARYELGICLAAAGRYPEALAQLLAAAEADRELAAGPAKEAMVQIFHLLGPQSELADAYRGRLAAVLY